MSAELETRTTPREAVLAYVVPQLALFAASALRSAPVTVAALALTPLLIPKRWLLLNWIGISLINFTLFVSGASWISLMATYYYAAVVLLRLGVTPKSGRQLLHESRFELAGIGVIAVSFVFVTRSQYFVATGIKSSIQLAFLLGLAMMLRQLDPRWFVWLRRQLLALLPLHLLVYGMASIVLWRLTGTGDRYGGMLGPQVCAFAYTLIFTMFWFAKEKFFAYLTLLGIALTGSRTYVGVAVVVIFAPLIARRGRLGTKIAASIGLVTLVVVGWEMLPYLSERFILNDDFYGTLLGRFLNYQSAVDHIHASPIFGQGMGSMLQVLENWIPEYFDYYVSSGDTTIVHNEYLRIVMETGMVGGGLVLAYVVQALRNSTSEARTMIVILLVASLTENTLAAYSTAMLLLMLLVRTARSISVAAPT